MKRAQGHSSPAPDPGPSVEVRTDTTVRDGPQDFLEIPEVSVAYAPPVGLPRTAKLGISPLLLGHGLDCGLLVDDRSVSRHHCEISLGEQGIRVRDLGSKNGTFVNGVRIESALLATQGVVKLGAATVTLLATRESSRVPLHPEARFGSVVGSSNAMRALFAQLHRASSNAEPLLLIGESGTGKELLARSVHQASRRAGPFEVLDCGSLSAGTLESQLFGHELGAFTGAVQAHRGIFEQADGGTLFLDGVEELPAAAQTRLLRVLQEGTLKRLGGQEPVRVDVRVIAASHVELGERIATGKFRSDLYFRLSVLEVRVPPLRERRQDIPLLVESMLAARTPPRTLRDLPEHGLELLLSHSWPGNVRELGNLLERMMLFPELTTETALEGLGIAMDRLNLPLREARERMVADFERVYTQGRLRRANGNVAAAARSMGISRQFLYLLMTRYGLTSEDPG